MFAKNMWWVSEREQKCLVETGTRVWDARREKSEKSKIFDRERRGSVWEQMLVLSKWRNQGRTSKTPKTTNKGGPLFPRGNYVKWETVFVYRKYCQSGQKAVISLRTHPSAGHSLPCHLYFSRVSLWTTISGYFLRLFFISRHKSTSPQCPD